MFNFCLFVFVVYAAGGSAWFILFGHKKLRLALRLPQRQSRSQRYAKKRRMAAYERHVEERKRRKTIRLHYKQPKRKGLARNKRANPIFLFFYPYNPNTAEATAK